MSRTSLLLDRRTLMAGTAAATLAAAASAKAATPTLELVATFTSPRQVTGVAVSRTGRIFANFPRWEEDVAISVGELMPDGSLVPFPDAAWNAFRNADPSAASPEASFVCVQSVTVDAQGRLWVLDAAAPGLSFIVSGGPKLVCIDLSTNTVSRIYRFGTDTAPQGTYLNDVRFTQDGAAAVITNSGTPGSLIVLDLASGVARRVLDGHPSTQFDPNLVITVGGRALRMLDGQPPHFSADGLIIDPLGAFVFWQATTGDMIYAAPLAVLLDASLSAEQVGASVHGLARSFVADGYWLTRELVPLLTSCEDNSVKRINVDGSYSIEVQDDRLLWPDSMAEGPDGMVYVTASHIPDMKMWQGPGVTATQLFRFRPR